MISVTKLLTSLKIATTLIMVMIISSSGFMALGAQSLLITGPTISNVSWSTDSETLVFQTFQALHRVNSIDNGWYQYSPVTEMLTNTNTWALQPALSLTELAMFTPATDENGSPSYIWVSPSERYIIYAESESRYLTIGDRLLGELIHSYIVPDPYQLTDNFKAFWSADESAVAFISLSGNNIPFTFYIDNLTPSVTQANITIAVSTTVNGQDYSLLQPFDISADGSRVLMLVQEYDPVEPFSDSETSIMIWNALNPNSSHVIPNTPTVSGASFAPGDENKILIVSPAGLIQYDISLQTEILLNSEINASWVDEAIFSPNGEWVALREQVGGSRELGNNFYVASSVYLLGSVALQGRSVGNWDEPLEVKLYDDASPTPNLIVGETITADPIGRFAINDVEPGNYQLWVKHSQALANLQSVTWAIGDPIINLGTLRSGDANDDNLVTLPDFSILASTYGKSFGQDGYDVRADFNGDGVITLPDFSLLASNFGQAGDADPESSSLRIAPLSSGTVDMTLNPAVNNVAIGQEFDVTVRVEAGTQLVDGAAAYLTFDPALLEVVSRTAGTNLPTVLANSHNNTTGRVSFAAGALEDFPTATFDLVTVRFRALAVTASTGINYVTDNPLHESGVTYAGESVLNATESAGVTITDPNLIFKDGFKSGSLSAWSSSTTDSGDLSVTTSAALVGTYGMQSVIDDNTAIYVTDNSPTAETRYRVRFSFDPNSIESVAGNSHVILIAQTGGSPVRRAIQIDLLWSGNLIVGYNYSIRARTQNDAGTYSTALSSIITDAPHVIEAEWIKATAAGANNGSLKLWIDGVLIGTVSGIDNDQRTVETVQWGTVEGVTNFIRGTYYFDDFESRRD